MKVKIRKAPRGNKKMPMMPDMSSMAGAIGENGLSIGKAKEILHDGTAHGKKLTDKQRKYFGWIASGGKAENGAYLEPLTQDMSLFHGPSHDNGGIPYKGVEVEGNEPLYKNLDGSETVFGNAYIPGTKMKFKEAAKNLAKKEQRVDKLMNSGAELVNAFDWKNKWDELKFNAGSAMLQGAKMKKDELKQNKEHLANLQQALLETADDMGADPFHLSKGKIVKAKNGIKLYENGGNPDDPKKKQSMAVRMNNPGNIKFGAFAKKFGAVQGDPATDGGYFAKFPDSESGMKALKGLLKTDGYKNLSVDAAIKRWTNGSGYSVNYKDIKDKTVGQLSDQEFQKLIDTITVGEDGKYYKPGDNIPTPENKSYIPDYITPELKTFTPGVPKQKNAPRTVKGDNTPLDITQPKDINIPSNAKGLDWYQVSPELAAFAQSKVEPVWMQQYNPQLYQPTRVSFQDRLNDNQTSFNSLSRMLKDNPEALATLAGQKYGADNSIRGDEFRTNQQIEQDVVNKNISLLNDAQLKNLSLADTQYVRQSQARSNTKAINNTILNSITGKVAQNEARNQALKYYESMTGFRYNPDSGKVEWMGGNYADYLPTDGTTTNSTPSNSSTKQTFDNKGNLKSTTYTSPSWLDQAIKQQTYDKNKYQKISEMLGSKKKTNYPFQENGGNITKFFNSNK